MGKKTESGTLQEGDLQGRMVGAFFPASLGPRTERERRRFLLRNLWLHFRPTTVPAAAIRFRFTWGLGGAATVLLLLQFGSGILLKFVYEPVPAQAYESLLRLQADVTFGTLVRNLHFWSANLLVAAAVLHGLRVFFTGAFHPPRQLNWMVGLCLLTLVLAANLTGYLLPWDQLAYWATTVCSGMLEYLPWIGEPLRRWLLGGSQIGPATLRIFFALHTAVLPAILLPLMAFHFWRVRKAGGLAVPADAGADEPHATRPTSPDLLLREATAGLAVIAGVLVLALLFDAPLGPPANPGLSPNPTKAPWYFAGVQETLMHLHPTTALILMGLTAFATLLLVPTLHYPQAPIGTWFASPVGRRSALAAAAAAALLTPLAVALDEYLVDVAAAMSALPPAISTGLVPLAIFLAILAGLYRLVARLPGASMREAVQAVAVFLVVTLGMLTVICVWLRGEGMQLRWTI